MAVADSLQLSAPSHGGQGHVLLSSTKSTLFVGAPLSFTFSTFGKESFSRKNLVCSEAIGVGGGHENQKRQLQPWQLSQRSLGTNKNREVVMSSLHESLVNMSSYLVPLLLELPQQLNASSSSINSSLMFVVGAAEGAVGYSLASYYTSLGLFVICVSGLWSIIKRFVESKRHLIKP